jgi:RimJ/RimL family protein N-acetyltransferase
MKIRECSGGFMFIITERLFLRPVWREDAAMIHDLLQDWDIVSRLARVPWPYALADAQAFTRYAETAYDDGKEMILAICLRPSLQVIGVIGCQRHETGEREIGYWLGKAYWGHGFASEAVQGLIEGLFDSLRLPVLSAGYQLSNAASAHVLAKLGFEPTFREDQFCRAQNRTVPVQQMKLTRARWQARRDISTQVAA